MMCRSGAVCVHGVGRNEGRFGRLGGRALARKPDPIFWVWIHSRLFLYLFLVEFGLGVVAFCMPRIGNVDDQATFIARR